MGGKLHRAPSELMSARVGCTARTNPRGARKPFLFMGKARSMCAKQSAQRCGGLRKPQIMTGSGSMCFLANINDADCPTPTVLQGLRVDALPPERVMTDEELDAAEVPAVAAALSADA